jgi:tRNA(Ile)-lysidine synthase
MSDPAAAGGLLETVAATIDRFAMYRAGDVVGVAVSGGADSVCLLEVLAELRARIPVRLVVLHLNHQLRGAESDADEEFVRGLAAGFGLECVAGRVTLAGGENLEQAARQARRRFFAAWIAETATGGERRVVATGHTRSDQAETVLFRFLRGSGTQGLAGILPTTAEGVVRPLLLVSREQVGAWLAERGRAFRTDSSNLEARFARNRIRRDLLPHLANEWNPAIEGQLAHTAELARAEESFWSGYLARLAGDLLAPSADGVVVRVDALTALPLAAARRLVRYAFARVKGDLRQIEFRHVEQTLALATQESGAGRLQLPGVDVFRSFDWLRVGPLRVDPVRRIVLERLQVPGLTGLPDGTTVETRLTSNASEDTVYNKGRESEWECVDFEKVTSELTLRYWLPGDAYRPVGAERVENIKTMFQSARIPLWERRYWPIVESGDQILWARGFGVAQAHAASSGSRRILQLRLCSPVRAEKLSG